MPRTNLVVLTSSLLAVALSAQQSMAVVKGGGFANAAAPQAELLRHRVVVRFRRAASEASVRDFARMVGLRLADRGRGGEFYVFECTPEIGRPLARWFAAQSAVDYAELEAMARTTVAPSDPYWAGLQWNMYIRRRQVERRRRQPRRQGRGGVGRGCDRGPACASR